MTPAEALVQRDIRDSLRRIEKLLADELSRQSQDREVHQALRARGLTHAG